MLKRLLFDNLQLCQMDVHSKEYADMAEAEKILFNVNMLHLFSYNWKKLSKWI